jgi:hypothetical protein
MSDSLTRAKLEELSDTQMHVYGSLSQIKPTLANMYLGALRAIPVSKGGTNPEALVQAAHSIRELMQELPRHLNAPIYAPGESLANWVNNLLPKWTGVRDSVEKILESEKHNDPIAGTDWSKLRRFLREIINFFNRIGEVHKTRRERTRLLLQATEGHPEGTVVSTEEATVTQWMYYRDWFMKVAHHRHNPTEAEFAKVLTEFEILLFGMVGPSHRVIEELDRIISGDKEAKS